MNGDNSARFLGGLFFIIIFYLVVVLFIDVRSRDYDSIRSPTKEAEISVKFDEHDHGSSLKDGER